MKNILIVLISLLCLAACSKKPVGPTPTVAPARDKFLGIWTVNEQPGTVTTAAQYAVSISASDNGATSEHMSIINFHNLLTAPVSAYAAGDSIYIPVQSAGGYTVFGAGHMSYSATYGQFGTITMSYEITDATSVIAIYGYNGHPFSIWGK